ncbi:GTPase IMAP family member 8 [Paralichthys olivaceus]|uniref:GTPase IMAP family member 8 n=1 Tax=Paralichthys olivaceus TaxID=8255 RepID=UPI003750B90A
MSDNLRSSHSGSSTPELRLVLLGNLGCGKTSSSDTILGQLSPISPSAARSCQLRQGFTEGRSVTLVEAPRWYWNGGKMEDSVREETKRVLTLAAPGPHAILLLVPVGQFTEMESRVPAELEQLFGEESLDHTLLLLTCGDYLMGRTVEEYLQKELPGLRKIIERCGGRFHVINNRQRQDREQVRQLLEKVENMVQAKGVYHRKTVQEQDLERRVNERRQELMESYRAQKEGRTESRGVEGGTTLETWKRQERDKTEGRAGGSQISNGLHSTPAPERESYSSYSQMQDDRQAKRTPSFRLNQDGAILSQMSEVDTPPKKITTFHHRINSFEERSPEASPTSSPYSPVFSSSPSSPTFTASSYSVPSSYSTSSSTFASASASPTSSSSFPSSSSSSTVPSSSTSSTIPSSYSTSSSTFASASRTSSSSFPSSSSSSTVPSSSTSSTIPSSYSTSSSTFASASRTSSSSFPSSSSSSTVPSFSTSSTLPSSYSTSSSTFASASSTSYPSSSSSSPELRLVLLGRAGAGKSAAGNSILGGEEFKSDPDSLTSITQQCEKKKALVEGRRVAVVDTPDWFTSERTPDEVRAQISSCVALSSPGPHAFLLCVPLDQPAKTELQALRALEVVFGPDAIQKHTLVLFTYADRLRESGKAGNDSVEAYIAGQRGDLLNLVEKCRDRFHVLESKGGRGERRNVVELLDKVEQTVKEAGEKCYSCPAFQEAENRVRQRQVEIAREKKSKSLEQEKSSEVAQLNSERRVLYPYMQPVAEAEEEVREDEIEKTRHEAEMSVSTMDIESLPPITLSSLSPSLLRSIMEKMESSAKMLPKLLSNGSTWAGEGAKKVKSSPVWGTVGSGAQNVQKMVVDSSVWGKMGAGAKQASKLLGDRVPKVVVDGSSWVGSGAKAATASPMWGKVGSGAKLVADRSMRVGAGIGTGAKSLAQSPVWGKVGSGAKSGAKLMADGSLRVGAGIGAGAKTVAQSPAWGKMGSGAKAGAKMVAESPMWKKIGTTAKQVPKVVIAGALLGLLLGVFLGGVLGGAIGAAAGSAVTEVGRRKLSNKTRLEKTNEAAKSVERKVNDSVNSLAKQGEKVLKTE